MTNSVTDTVIVGGGPAGLYAGLCLARAGFRVDLFEEHRECGTPVHCTGVLAGDAFAEFQLSSDALLNELTTVCFYAPSGQAIEYTTSAVEAVAIDRAVFDRQLAERAAAEGVAFHRERVVAVDRESENVVVTTASSQRRARSCVLACGASYALHRRLGLGIPRLLLNTVQAEVPAARMAPVEVHFGSCLAPGGFAWAVPVRRRDGLYVRVGVMGAGAGDEHFQRTVAAVRPRWGIDHAPIRPRRKILPLSPIERTYGDRLIVVGDAAGLVKPTTGGGIYYSLLSARLAARVLTPALLEDDLRAAALAPYQREWRKRLGLELRWQTMLRRLAQELSDDDINRLFDLGRSEGLLTLARRTASFNRHREFIMALLRHPPARKLLLKNAFA